MTSFRAIIAGLALASCVSLQASFFSKFWNKQIPAPDENGPHYVIIGASKYGLEAAREIRRKTHSAKITVVDSDSAIGWSQQEADSLHIKMRLGVDVYSVDTQNQFILFVDGEWIHFDSILFAPYATDNAHALKKYIGDDLDTGQTIKRVVIEGGDFEALKLVHAVALCTKFRKHQGKRVEIDITLVVNDDQLARDNLDAYASQKAIDCLKAYGVDVRLNSTVTSFDVSKESCTVNHAQRIEAVTLSNGERIEAQLLVKPGLEKQVLVAQKLGFAIEGSGIRVHRDLNAAGWLGDGSRGHRIFAVGNITIPAVNMFGHIPRDMMKNKHEQVRVAVHNMMLQGAKIFDAFREFYKPQIIIPRIHFSNLGLGLYLEGIGAEGARRICVRNEDTEEYTVVFCDKSGLIQGLCRTFVPRFFVKIRSIRIAEDEWNMYKRLLLERLTPPVPKQPNWLIRTLWKAI